MRRAFVSAAAFLSCGLLLSAVGAQTTAPITAPLIGPDTATLVIDGASKPISRDLFGIFFEDLNYAADGGLYAELIQNRSFEYTPGDNKSWTPLTNWTLVEHGGKGAVRIVSDAPLNSSNPHYAVLDVETSGEGVGLSNAGFDGITLTAGDTYDFSIFASQLAQAGSTLIVRLETPDGKILAEATLPRLTSAWTKYTATLIATADAKDARLIVLTRDVGSVALDMVSLFPRKTFHNRPNGLRADLAQVIADLKPRFIRFPGGCLAHGDGLDNMYRWKDTIGPVEQRRAQRNIWRYHQTVGLGYYEYFQFCEDIGAKPLPVVAAGVCCQNAGGYIPGAIRGQQGLPMDQMPDYIQEVLDLIEYANGPVSSKYGALRAAAGHPAPFNLQYLGIGNEDQITDNFKQRFKLIHDAVKLKYPDLVLIGTVGPNPNGRDFDEGWKFAHQENLAMVDEHYYKPPDWFWNNLSRYNAYDRKATHVYVGEYAAHDARRENTLRSALAEAAMMTSYEQNADVVRLVSYAPLLAKQGHTQWRPDMIYFDNTTITPSINYYVQQLFATYSGDLYFPSHINTEGTQPASPTLATSCVKDSATGEIILKIVSRQSNDLRLTLDLTHLVPVSSTASCTLLAGDPSTVNTFGQTPRLLPKTLTLSVTPSTFYVVPANSLSVIRIKAQ